MAAFIRRSASCGRPSRMSSWARASSSSACAGASSRARSRARTLAAVTFGSTAAPWAASRAIHVEAFDRIARGGRVLDRAPEVEHRGEAVVRAAASRVVQGAPLGAQHALERLPSELAKALKGADLAAQAGPQLFERADQAGPRARVVDRRVDPRARVPVARVEREEVDRSMAVGRRLERPREHDADPRLRLAAPRDVAPRGGRHERLDGRRRRRRRQVLLLAAPRLELRERDAAAFDVHARVDERREAEPQPAPFGGDAEGDHDGAGARHRSDRL